MLLKRRKSRLLGRGQDQGLSKLPHIYKLMGPRPYRQEPRIQLTNNDQVEFRKVRARIISKQCQKSLSIKSSAQQKERYQRISSIQEESSRGVSMQFYTEQRQKKDDSLKALVGELVLTNPTLKRLSDGLALLLLKHANIRHLRAGQQVFKIGEPVSFYCLVLMGRLTLENKLQQTLIKEGDVFDYKRLQKRVQMRTETLTARSDCVVAEVTREQFDDFRLQLLKQRRQREGQLLDCMFRQQEEARRRIFI